MELLLAVNQSPLRVNTSNVRTWSGGKFGLFSVSNFALQVNKQLEIASSPPHQGILAWRNVAPPRAQLHIWFLLHGKLNTKVRLYRFGVKGIDDDRCVLCKEEPESIEHLFFGCKISSSLWYSCCERWNISMCLPNQLKACLLSWLGTPFRDHEKRFWTTMFYVISWSIWDIRNKVSFQNFNPIWEVEKKQLFCRLESWMKGRGQVPWRQEIRLLR